MADYYISPTGAKITTTAGKSTETANNYFAAWGQTYTLTGYGPAISFGNYSALYTPTAEFDGNRITFTVPYTSGSGGAIYLYNSYAKGMELSHVDFIGNTSSGDGGAIYVGNGATQSSLTDCRFFSNRSNAQGGAIKINAGTVSFPAALSAATTAATRAVRSFTDI